MCLSGFTTVACPTGLKEVDDQVEKLSSHVLDRRLVQVVLSRASDLVGKTIRETRFRSRFDAAIVAIHREGARQSQKIGDVNLLVWIPLHIMSLICVSRSCVCRRPKELKQHFAVHVAQNLQVPLCVHMPQAARPACALLCGTACSPAVCSQVLCVQKMQGQHPVRTIQLQLSCASAGWRRVAAGHRGSVPAESQE
jgi:hypothetical protein